MSGLRVGERGLNDWRLEMLVLVGNILAQDQDGRPGPETQCGW